MRLVSQHTLATLLYVGGIVGRLQTIEASPSVHRPVLAVLRTRARTPVRAAWVGSVLPDKPKGGMCRVWEILAIPRMPRTQTY